MSGHDIKERTPGRRGKTVACCSPAPTEKLCGTAAGWGKETMGLSFGGSAPGTPLPSTGCRMSYQRGCHNTPVLFKLPNHAVDTVKNIIFRTYLEHLGQIANLKITSTTKRIIFSRKLADQIKLESQGREIRYDVCLRCLSSVKSVGAVSWTGLYTFIFSRWPSPAQVFSKVQ